MRRFRTTTFFVEGRDRPERRRRVYGVPRLVALAVGLPVLVLWFVPGLATALPRALYGGG